MIAAAALAVALAMRSPDQTQAMADLAHVLGQAHALRQACAPGDQGWRERMNRLMEVEAPDEALRRRLVEAFNAGFLGQKAEHPACDPGVARAERETARRGEALSQGLVP